ncbi:Heparinase II/III-like protein [compost metagenome]
MTITSGVLDIAKWDRVREGRPEPSSGQEELALRPGQPLILQFPGVHLDSHWEITGFVSRNDYTVDLCDWHALELDMELPLQEPVELKAEIGLLKDRGALPEAADYAAARAVVVPGADGTAKAVFSLAGFNDVKALSGKWKFVRSVTLTASWNGSGAEAAVMVKRIQLIRRPAVYVSTPVYSKAVPAGGTAAYTLTILNCTGDVQPVMLSCEKYGWEAMDVHIEPELCVLQPGKSGKVTVYVHVPEQIAPGGHEELKLTAVPGGRGDQAETLTLTTLCELPRPFIKHTEEGWDEVRENIRKHGWMRELMNKVYEQRAEQWELAEVNRGPFLFRSHHATEAENAAIVWKLTGREDIAEKAVQFLRASFDSEWGYPVTRQACHQELVHEGEYFNHAATIYDLLADSGLLTEEDHANVRHSFRLFIDLIDYSLSVGDLSNWTLAELAGALSCSQALQDLERINRFLFGTGGFTDHLSKGTLDDGWWYECSVGYNTMSAGLFTEIAQSCRPWGINLTEYWVPATYNNQITPGDKPDKDGLCLDIWGPRIRNHRSIRQLWDSLLPFSDYRGVVFGINDSTETKLLGISERGYLDGRYDLAYYLYRKPEYGDIALTCKLEDRDLLYAVPGIQPSNSKRYLESAYADTSGVAVLRSQTGGREPHEQIQAVLKYGIHGGAHGHYDRVSLLSIMRYGRSFYNPENVWYSYHTFMYKFYVQSSITHNMVVVDRKQQDPAEARRLLFHSGSVFQACAVENTARWSYPPYGGWRVENERTVQERVWNEGRTMPVPVQEPEYTKRTGFTEPVLQRRLMVVTDDYVALFDYAAGEREHEYDCLFHSRGFKEIEGAGKQLSRHTVHFDPDPLGGAQLITDCEWYDMRGPVKAHFEMGFGPGYDNNNNRTALNEDGPLLIDHYTLWPPEPEMIIGNDPEFHKVDKKLYYRVLGDGRELASGQFGAWIFGRDDLDLPVAGVETLELRVRTEEGAGDNGLPKMSEKTVFWGDPYVETADGRRIDLADLPLVTENTDPGNGIGVDYFGGPVKLAVKRYDRAVPANPLDTVRESVIRVNLAGLGAVRLVAAIGGDYPLGDETHRRKMLSVRSTGKIARFVTLIEPYENRPAIVSAAAVSADALQVKLTDGRVQTLTIKGLEGGGGNIGVELTETDAQGRTLREERTGR